MKFIDEKIKFLDSLSIQILHYFPEGTFADFEIFVPSKLPRNEANAQTYGHNEIQNIASRFNLDPASASREWVNLLTSLVTNEHFCNRVTWTPEKFWSFYLRSGNIDWQPTIKRLIQIVLVLPANSADAERSFSIMNHIKYDRRARLSSLNLDHLMRIRINGPRALDRFASGRYARAWVKAGHLRTDDPMQQRKRKAEVLEDDEDTVESEKIRNILTSDLF
jgi:hypothetical protein